MLIYFLILMLIYFLILMLIYYLILIWFKINIKIDILFL